MYRRKRIKSTKPTRSQLNALEKLKRLGWSLHIIWGDKGIPAHLCGVLSVQIEESPKKAARKFLLEYFRLFRMKENLEDLKFIRETDSLGGYHVLFQQVFGELPVYNAFTSVHMDKNTRINKIDACYYPDLLIELPIEKGISLEDAIRIALDALHGEKRPAKAASAERVIYLKKIHIMQRGK